MNPPIHTANWYHAQGICEAAKSSGRFSPSKGEATVDFGRFFIKCNYQSWRISTSDQEKANDLVQIATKTFDEILKHTPRKELRIEISRVFDTSSSSTLSDLKRKFEFLQIDETSRIQFLLKGDEQNSMWRIYTCPTGSHLHVDYQISFNVGEEPLKNLVPDIVQHVKESGSKANDYTELLLRDQKT